MGKTSKKSATKVDSAVVAAKPLPKGKREAEVISKKDVSKKQKVEEKKVLKKKVESSSEEDSSESEDLPKTKLPVKNGKVESDSEDDSGVEEESSSDEEAAPAKKAPAVKAAAKKEDSSDEESDESEEESSDEEEKAPAAAAKPKVAAVKKKDETSDESDSEDDSDDEDAKPAAPVTKAATKKKAESDDEEESSDAEGTSDEEETPAKSQKKNDTDVKMTDVEKTPKTPSAPQGNGSKTLFVGNMSFSVEEADVKNFFKSAGEVVDVRFAMKDDSFRGFGHVEFATSEEAQKALNELNGKDLCGRPVRLDLAREKGAYTPGGDETQSYQKGARSNGDAKTVFVKGFDKYKSEDEIRSALEEHFASCGEMTRCSIPSDRETGDVKGMAYIDFSDSAAFNKALELDGSEFGDRSLTVNEATPRDNSGGGGFGGRSGGGRSSGGRFGRGDRDSGRGRRGRGGRDGGRGRGGRDGGRGYSKPNATFGGRKTTFD